MKNLIVFILIIFNYSLCNCQNERTKAYIEYKYLSRCTKNPDSIKKMKLKALNYLKKEDIVRVKDIILDFAYEYNDTNSHILSFKNLFKACRYGLSYNTMSEEPKFDSLYRSNALFRRKFDKNYSYYISKKCDVENSIKIIQLHIRDQNCRMFFINVSDTNVLHFKYYKLMPQIDSMNYFELLKIMKSPGFDSRRLMTEAIVGMGLILTHASTNDFVNSDTVLSILKKEMFKGCINEYFYANAVDRYYMNIKHLNYYYNFKDKKLPIYDIQNVDKRRKEIGLPPLYIQYKNDDMLDKLPKDYKYDSNTLLE